MDYCDSRSMQFNSLPGMAEQNTMQVVFPDIKPGRYALAAYADLNGNRTLDLNFIGMPIEPYGFSRDARNVLTISSSCAWRRLTSKEQRNNIQAISHSSQLLAAVLLIK